APRRAGTAGGMVDLESDSRHARESPRRRLVHRARASPRISRGNCGGDAGHARSAGLPCRAGGCGMRRPTLLAIAHIVRGAAAALAIAAPPAAADGAAQPRSPSWLQTSAEYRFRLESVEGARFQPRNDD